MNKPKFKPGDIVYTIGKENNIKHCEHCGSWYEDRSDWKVFYTPLYIGTVETSSYYDYDSGEDIFIVGYELFVECDKDDPMYNENLDEVYKSDDKVFTKEEVDAGVAQAKCDELNEKNQ